MGFYDAFFGSDQSLYTAYAIIAAIISICVTILFTSTDIPIGSRLLMILFVVITLVPSIFLTLFEITCIVTGGTEPNNWWCYTFAWILSAFIIIYCAFVVIISIISLVTYNKAIDNVNDEEEKNKVNPKEANDIAKQIMATQQPTQMPTQKPVEKFYDNNNDDMNNIMSMMQQGGTGNLINNLNSAMNFDKSSLTDNNIAPFTDAKNNTPPTQSKFTDYNNIAPFTDAASINKTPTPPNPPTITKFTNNIAPFTNNNNIANFTTNKQIGTFSNYDDELTGTEEDHLSSYPDIFNTK